MNIKKINCFALLPVILLLLAASAQASEETFEITTFSEKWSFKDCVQAEILFPTSTEFSTKARTDINDEDCSDVKAARGAVLRVPAGVQRVRVEIFLDQYKLNTGVSVGFAGYANAYSAVGIRVGGLIVGTPNQVNYFRHRYLDTSWSVTGVDDGSITETDVRMQCSFVPLLAADYTIQAYTRVTVDTDGWAYSNSFAQVKGLRKIRVTFVR